MQARFQVIDSYEIQVEDGDNLCLQKIMCREQYGEKKVFRFIRKSPEGKMKPQRGGAVIFKLEEIADLLALMMKGEVKNPKASRTPPPLKIKKDKK